MEKTRFYLIIILFLTLPCFGQVEKNVKRIDLDGSWQFRQEGDLSWKEAAVPGIVHLDLLAAGLIKDPFYGTHEKDLQWIGRENWKYRRVFSVNETLLKKDQIQLCFEGLDTFAEVYLNQKKILVSDNMFRTYKVDVKEILAQGDNTLEVLFLSPLKMGMKEFKKFSFQYPASNDQAPRFKKERVSPFIRKAPYHFGWDWGPRFLTMGIFRPVYLLGIDRFNIENLYFIQERIGKDGADLKVEGVFRSRLKTPAQLTVKIGKKTLLTRSVQLKAGVNRQAFQFSIPQPELWWPNGYGKPHLYNIQVEVSDARGNDRVDTRIGLRTIELVREKEEGQKESFFFRVNGIPLYMKGANYIPNDSFLTRVTQTGYDRILHLAADAGMNMLRVWGGGIYENDYFYKVCDEKGILIWQDFMFACSMYPAYDSFLNNIRREGKDNIIRLRNHPCIALWCGNNEIEGAWNHWGWQKTVREKGGDSAVKLLTAEYERIFHKTLPELVRQFDPETDYWPSSPAMDMDIETGDTSLEKGDFHYWGVWHGEKPFSEFKNNIPRFMSEFGFQSFPGMETIKSFSREADLEIESEVMRFHQRHPRGNTLIKKYLDMDLFVPVKFEDFIYMSQLLAAKGMQVGIEAQRRARPYCMGTLYWQLNDCWPVASWSGIDYYQRPKALHYYVKRSYKKVLISPDLNERELKIHVVSDRLSDFKGKIKLILMDFGGQIFFKKEAPVQILKNTAREHLKIPLKEILKDYRRERVFLTLEISEGDTILSSSEIYFSKEKDLELTQPTFNIRTTDTFDGYQMEIVSDVYVKDLYIHSKKVEGYFSDNFFNLIPHRKKTIKFYTENKSVGFPNQVELIHFKDIQQRR